MVRGMVNFDLPAPHGFLIWRGKQIAIASNHPIEAKEVMITSNQEAFGYATLATPVQLNTTEFDKYNEEHLISQAERRLLWADSKAFWLYRIKNWRPFRFIKKLGDNGKIIKYVEPSPEEAEIIELSCQLPKTIILDREAVTFDGKSFSADIEASEYVGRVLEATFQKPMIQVTDTLPMALYQLALVKVPNPRMIRNSKG